MILFQKSSDPDFFNTTLINKLDLLLKEQRAQRLDLSVINALLKSFMADIGTQKQVDDYFEENDETSPQTDNEDKKSD